MYSNLRVENGEWNHLILPLGVSVLDHQHKLNRVLAGEDAAGDAVPPGYWTDFELRRRLGGLLFRRREHLGPQECLH